MKFPKSLEPREFRDEHDLQGFIVGRLRHLGYVVEVSSSNVRGRRQHRGVSDLFVRCRDWPKAHWLHSEIKGAKTPLSVEQEEAYLMGNIVIWRSWLEACTDLGLPIDEQTKF